MIRTKVPVISKWANIGPVFQCIIFVFITIDANFMSPSQRSSAPAKSVLTDKFSMIRKHASYLISEWRIFPKHAIPSRVNLKNFYFFLTQFLFLFLQFMSFFQFCNTIQNFFFLTFSTSFYFYFLVIFSALNQHQAVLINILHFIKV